MTLTIPNPSNVKISFNTRDDFIAASIPSGINYVIAAGLLYERDSAGTALSSVGGDKWSPHVSNITPMHWGAVPDGATDAASAIQAMFDWGAVKQAEVDWISGGNAPDYSRLVYDMGQGTYAVSQEIQLNADNSHCTIMNASLVAIGTGWSTTGTDIIWQDGAVTSPAQVDPELAITGTVYFRHELDDFIFKCKSSCTYVAFVNPDLNCNGKCGGLFLRTRCIVFRPQIHKIGWVERDTGTAFGSVPTGSSVNTAYAEEGRGAIGIFAASGDVHIRDGWVGQFDQTDPEYYDARQYNAIGIYADDSDLTVIGTKIRWCWSNIVLTGTNHRFSQIHSFNGMRSYSYGDRSAERDQNLVDQFGITLAAAATTDLPIRYYHAGVAVMAHKFTWDSAAAVWTRTNGKNWDNSFDNCYFDNCHFDLHSDGVRFNNPKLGAKPTSSLSYPGATYSTSGASVFPTGSIDYWWKAWANGETNQVQRLTIKGIEPFVEGTVKKIVEFADNDEVWLNKGIAFGTLSFNEMDETTTGTIRGDNWEMSKPSVRLNPQKGDPAIVYFTFGNAGSFMQFADGTTSATSGALDTTIKFGGEGDNAIIQNDNGNIELTLNGGAGNIVLTADETLTRYIRLVGLPTTNPGGTDRLWNDAGTLKIT